MDMSITSAMQPCLPGLPAYARSIGMDTRGPVLAFVLPCLPTAQQRARHATTPGGFHRAYKSSAQEANERTLEAFLLPHVPTSPLEGGLELCFCAVFSTPRSGSGKERAAMLRGGICHTVKPDLDNLAKQLKDAMTRMGFWGDDKQVVRLVGEKRYGERPAWHVVLRRVGEARQAAKTRKKAC